MGAPDGAESSRARADGRRRMRAGRGSRRFGAHRGQPRRRSSGATRVRDRQGARERIAKIAAAAKQASATIPASPPVSAAAKARAARPERAAL